MKKLFSTLIALLAIALSVQAQNQMHVNMKDGSIMNVFVSEIQSVTWDDKENEPVENNPDDPTVTGDAINITENSATIIGYANNVRDNESTDLGIGVIYCTEGTPNKSNGEKVSIDKNLVSEDGKYIIGLSQLGPGTTYYYRSFVYQSGLWFYGKVRSFSTKRLGFTTGEVTSVTCFSAKAKASFNAPSDITPSEYGICFGIAPDSTKFRSKATTKDADGNYTATLYALMGNTIYYYRPYAVVNGMISYGQISSFKTLEDNVVVTGEMDADGNVRSRLTIGGGAYRTLEVGLCWSRDNEQPTVNDFIASSNELDDGNCYVITPPFIYAGIYYYRAYVKIDGIAHYGAVVIRDSEKGIMAVDLGLSVKWASFNIGASAPEDYGWYLAWGETRPKAQYDWNTYFDSVNGSDSNFSNYNNHGGKRILSSENDAATVNWGAPWRMPTISEFEELIEKCDWTWTTLNGVIGYKVSSRTNGNCIFLPAGGSRWWDDDEIIGEGTWGYYWPSTLNSDYDYIAYNMSFHSNFCGGRGDTYRYVGQSVRPVCP